MGDITKTITIKVPAKVIYDFLKESLSYNWVEIYCKDLAKGLLTEYSLYRDVPNRELSFTSGKWGSKVDVKFFLKEIDSKTTEVTCQLGYFLVLGASASGGMIDLIGTLIALERGYTAGAAQH